MIFALRDTLVVVDPKPFNYIILYYIIMYYIILNYIISYDIILIHIPINSV